MQHNQSQLCSHARGFAGIDSSDHLQQFTMQCLGQVIDTKDLPVQAVTARLAFTQH